MQKSAVQNTVLVVEDEMFIREMISSELREAGFAVVEAESGDDALATLPKLAQVDALLTDIRMPGAADGWTVAERCCDAFPGLPVVYVSGYITDPMRLVPGSVFLRKPYLPHQVVHTIKGLCATRA